MEKKTPEKFSEGELKIVHRIDVLWLKLQILNVSANGLAFFFLGYLGMINRYTLIFLGMFCFSLFLGARKILREQLDTQEKKVLDRLQYIP